MISCPGCGGGLRFDIPSQQLACDYCHTFYNPYDFDPQKADAEETKEFDATVFTCPQCGGEILSTDDSITGFCSFCGASSVLQSRVQKVGRPNFIIPFRITKDQCKESYAAHMKKSLFAPKELRDPKYIDGFRGIYMPYWTYYVTQAGHVNIPGERSHREGDYMITEQYSLSGDLNAYYKGISYDASSSFNDNISESLAPYDVKGMQGFTPAYLSGFYADSADIESLVYEPDATELAFEETQAQLQKQPAFRGYHPHYERLNPGSLGTCIEQTDYSMFPVWFLSYRNKDRVAYATVNGQTGKIVTDTPIDIKKVLLFSLLFAIPIFALCYLFFHLSASTAMVIVSIIALVTLILYSGELKKIIKREQHLDDIGYLAKHSPEKVSEVRKMNEKKVGKKAKKDSRSNSMVGLIIFLIIFCGQFVVDGALGILALMGALLTEVEGTVMVIWLAVIIASIIVNVKTYKRFDQVPGKRGRAGITLTLLSICIGSAIEMLHTISYSIYYIPIMAYDWWYYIGIIIMILGMFFTIADIIRAYNILSTRRLPQFEHQGGDDRA